jgi:uncharacterized membrane protein YebE (DUF533 family)
MGLPKSLNVVQKALQIGAKATAVATMGATGALTGAMYHMASQKKQQHAIEGQGPTVEEVFDEWQAIRN